MSAVLQPHQERVVAEEAELAFKVGKLGEFIFSNKFKSVPTADQVLLIAQHTHMTGYLAVLRKRIESFGATA